jgi:3-dehydroquinate synthase
MILESYLSREMGLLNNDEYQEVKYIINDLFERILFTTESIEKIIDLLNFDKKNEFGKVQFVLLDGIGKSVINQTIDKSLIYKAFEDYSK